MRQPERELNAIFALKAVGEKIKARSQKLRFEKNDNKETI